MNRILAASIAWVVATFATGCATSMVRHSSITSEPYPATKLDAYFIAATVTHGDLYPFGRLSWWERPFGLVFFVIDTPVSIVFDTILLPDDLSKSRDLRKRIEQAPAGDGIMTAPEE